MTSFIVTNLNDSGTGSLREAIADANAAGGGTITFDPSLKGGKLTLTNGELDITTSISIDGEIDGTDIAIDGNNATRVLAVNDGDPNSTITATLNGLVIENGNTGTDAGGGIYVGGSDILKLSNSTVTGNTAGQNNGGGIDAAAHAQVSLSDVTLSDNTASGSGSGGAIYGNGGVVIGLTNCTVTDNSAGFGGGGIDVKGGSYIGLMNTTVTGNKSYQFGGGILNQGSGGYTTLTNSIVAGNQTLNGGDDLIGGFSGTTYSKLTFAGGNLVGSTPVGFASVSGVPTVQINGASQSDLATVFASLGPNPNTGVYSGTLANNGGPAETIALADSAANPAIDAGDDFVAGVPTTDARGFARYDFPGVANNGASISDLGAYEVSNRIVVTTLNDTVDPNDGQTSLREALALANSSAGNVTITFDPSLAGHTLKLTQGQLNISGNVTIDGDVDGNGTPDIAIDASGDNSRIFGIHGAATLDGLKLTGGDADLGGAVRVYSSGVSITDSEIYGNSASSLGGGVYVGPNAGLVLTDDTIFDNSTAGRGGGVADGFAGAPSLSLTNVTLTGNSAQEGGAIYAFGTTPLTNVTATGNSAAEYGGGIFSGPGSLTLTNSIVAGNYAQSGANDVRGSGLYSTLLLQGGNLIGSGPSYFNSVTGTATTIDGTSKTDLQTVFAQVGNNAKTGVLSGQLGNNSGNVPTVALNDSATNPAIDAGDDHLAPTTDARGFARSNFPGAANNGANISDLGAFEQQAPQTFVVTTLNDELDSTNPNATLADEQGGTGLSLREALFLANEDPTRAATITFAPSLAGGTLTLDQGLGLLKITAHDTTIDGDINGDGTPDITISGGNKTAVLFTAINGNTHTTLDGLVIENGYANPAFGYGGGIFVGDGDSLTLTNSTVADSSAFKGGGIFVSNNASLAMLDSTIAGNSASAGGGGIFGRTGAALTLTDATLSGNDAYNGGGIGGYRNDQISLTNTTLSGNDATNGGGIFGYQNAQINLSNTTLSGNQAIHGGGIFGVSDQISLTNTTLSGNEASHGGGIFGKNDQIGLSNSTLTGNLATVSNGGGIYTVGPSAVTTVTNSIVAGNAAASTGYDLDGNSGAKLVFTGGNILGSAPASFSSVDTTNGSYTPIDGASATALGTVFAQVGNNPTIGVLSGLPAGNGASVQTVALNPAGIAIDAGVTADLPPGTTTDERGFSRVVGLSVDIGAFEQQAPQTFVVTTLSDELDSNNPSATLADESGGTGLSLREALLLANEDPTTADTITFASNLSGGTIDLTLGQLKIDGSVTIEGGSDDITIDAGGSSRVFDAVAGTSTIDALTMTGGYSNHGGAVSVGTTISYAPADLTISNSTITGNQAAYGGGLAVNYGASLHLTNTTVSGNSAYLIGGGIASQGTLTLTNSTVDNNSSGYIGGGVANVGTLTMVDTTLANNRITGSGSPPAGNLTVTAGAGLYNGHYGSAALFNTTISGNSGAYAGGGIYNAEALTLTNVTLANNSASYGGGLANAYCGCGNAKIYDTTFTGNDATQSGGGIYNAAGSVSLANTIVAGNGAGYQGPDIVTSAAGGATTTYTGVNLFSQSGAGGPSDIYVSPSNLSQVFATLTTIDPDGVPNSGDEFQAGALANNGGHVETVLIEGGGKAQDAGDVAALPSDIEDLNNNGNTTEPLPVDARGDPRTVNGTLDLGALELQPPVVTPVSSNINASASEIFTPSQLFSVSAPVGSPVLTYEVEDESTGADNGFWVLNGAVLPSGQLTTLTAAQLSQLSFVAGSGSAPVSDTLEVAASDAAGLGAFATFTVTASAHASTSAPTVTAANELQAPGQFLAASNMFSATAFGGNTITSYEVEDTTADSGHWVFNGVVEPANQLIDVTVAQLSQLSFLTGYGNDSLKVRANDGTQWGNFTSFTITPPPNAAPPAGTADILVMLRNADGAYEFYDIGQNKVLLDGPLGQINPALQVAGVGGFDGSDTADLLMRDPSTGAFTLYDVSNNNITGSVALAQVGTEWTVSGLGDFSTRAGETDMLMRNSNTGAFEVYDIANSTVTFATGMGQVGLDWTVSGFGDFSGNPGETDMLMRNSNTGAFEVYDIRDNAITSAAALGGQIGQEWTVAGFGDFSTRANETDMLMRNSNTGAFEVYDIVDNAITVATGIGQVGLNWTVAGFGDFSGNANETDMLLRNSNTGAFELYDIRNNAITQAAGMGQVGTEWSISGVSPTRAGLPADTQVSQLTQAMASFAPSAGTAAASALLNQTPPPAIATSLLTTNHA